MAKSHKVNYVIWLLLFVGISGILFASSSSSQFYSFGISPLSYGGNIELPDTVCNFKVTVDGLDKNGKIVLSEQSSFLEKNPTTTFSLVGGIDNSEIEQFKVSNKMRCEFINNAPYVDMTASYSDLKINIFAKDSKGVENNVWNNVVRSNADIPIVENNERVLSTVYANTSDIKKYLENGDYETTLRFVTFGNVQLNYDAVPSVNYKVTIPDNKAQTFITLDVQKDGKVEPPKEPKQPDPKQPEDPKNPVNPLSTVDEFTKCIQAFDMSCLAQDKFLPYYIGSFGLFFLVGAVGTRNKPMFDQFGNRSR